MDREREVLALRALVYALAGDHRSSGEDYEEMVSDGWLGAIDAVTRYDPANEAGASLATFAKHRIRGAILDGIRDRGRLRVGHIRAIKAGRLPRPDNDIRLDEMLHDADGQGRESVVDQMEDVGASDAFDCRLGEVDFTSALTLLTPIQAYVVRERYWSDRTLSSLSEELGVSCARVCQITAAARKILKTHLAPAA